MNKLVCQKCKSYFESRGKRGPKPKYCPNCSNRYYVATTTTVVTNKLKYSWSKYGGKRNGILKGKLDFWSCQSCGQQQSRDLPSYMFPFTSRDYLRICSTCQNLTLKHNIDSFVSLTSIARTCKLFDNLDTVDSET